MKTRKLIAIACISLALMLIGTSGTARATDCCYFNPLALPFLVAGAAVATAAAIATAPFAPVYYGPYDYGPYRGYGYYRPYRGYGYYSRYYGPRAYYRTRPGGAWGPGYYSRRGAWGPGHYR